MEDSRSTQVPDRRPSGYRWWLIITLLIVGLSLVAGAFITEAYGWTGVGPTVLVQFGATVALVGVLVVLQELVVRDVTERLGDVIAVNTFARNPDRGVKGWHTSIPARPGDQIEYQIRFENAGSETLRDVVVANNLPKYHRYVPGTTMLRNGAYPSGLSLSSDNIVSGGIDVGNYDPGAVGYVRFTAELGPIEAYEKLGTYELANVGIARPSGMAEHYNVAKVLIEVEKPD